MLTITITNRQKTLPVDRRRIRRVVTAVLRDAGFTEARIGVALVDDPAIAQLHQKYLNDPTPTDVLSFLLESSTEAIEGEIVVSADTAVACAPHYDCTPGEELLRYIIHGALHLVGYDDATSRQRAAMRKKEDEYQNKKVPSPSGKGLSKKVPSPSGRGLG